MYIICDIIITAQPPGKKMKNINLLSGGEKALTAICILFAIIISRPTPFCILDEIEAPLDDINVYRFGEFLKELSEKALTAICILFAIIISRPTPFCILDEIEAPLDDINVYRFGEFLKELSQEQYQK